MGMMAEILTRLAPGAREERVVEPLSLRGLGVRDSQMLAEPVTTAGTIEGVAAVAASVQAIASAISGLPIYIYRRDGAARSEVFDHPVATMLRAGPNNHQTAADLIESWVASALLQGNGLLRILTGDNAPSGRQIGLRFIPWNWVTPVMLPSGRLAYDVAEGGTLNGVAGTRYRLLQDEVVHLRDRSDDGVIGRSRLSRSLDTFRQAQVLNMSVEALHRNGARPSYVLQSPEDVPADSIEQLKEQFESNHAGGANAGKTLLLTGGLEFKAVGITPEDAELLESRKFSLEEIARIFNVPPPMIGDLSHGTFTNSREAARWFSQFTLTPWVRKIEAEMNRALFPAGSGLEIEFDMSGLLRADPESRWASHKIAVDSGILDADEIREIEGYNKRGTAA